MVIGFVFFFFFFPFKVLENTSLLNKLKIKDIFNNDPEPECRSTAAYITNLIVQTVKEGDYGLYELGNS